MYTEEVRVRLAFSEPGMTVLLGGILSKRGKGSVGGRETGGKAKTTPDAGGKSVSEKSQAERTCRNPSRNQKVSRQNSSSVK